MWRDGQSWLSAKAERQHSRMSGTSIKVDGLSKRYRIGTREDSHDTLVGMVTAMLKAPIRNFKRLRKLINFSNNSEKDIVWALRDVSFQVDEGDVLGIVGRNGAGKSTLLKILSRITDPTSGYVEITGRVSSLLEVGTGFHPELTGRENVFLNGTILGMTKKEVHSKFDQIVAFSGMEKFIDTPIKWYSSGMQVRLAFSVAAHLDPQIMIVDEVLAVGDAEFQKKCLGKMENVAQSGRTVLFVSHNLNAIHSLCPKSLFLENGKVMNYGKTGDIIYQYLNTVLKKEKSLPLEQRTDRYGNGDVKVSSFRVLDAHNNEVPYLESGSDYYFEVGYVNRNNTMVDDFVACIDIYDEGNERVLLFCSDYTHDKIILNGGKGLITCHVKNLPLANGNYSFQVHLSDSKRVVLDLIKEVTSLAVNGGNYFGTGSQGDPEYCKILHHSSWSYG